MKRILLTICLLSVIAITYTVRAQEHVSTEHTNEWARENEENIKKMTRLDWQNLKEEYKWIAFTKLSPEQAHEFYKLKIEQVINNFDWSKPEKEHLDRLHQLFLDNPDIYRKDDKKKAEEINSLLKEWAQYAMEELKWSPKLIKGIVMNCEDLLDKEGNVRVTP